MAVALVMASLALIGTTVTLVFGFVVGRPLKKQVKEVHDSTVNSHGPDMREQLDGIGDKISVLVQAVAALAGSDDRHMSHSKTAWAELRVALAQHGIVISDWPEDQE